MSVRTHTSVESGRRLRTVLLAGLLIVAFDQATKALVRGALPLHSERVVIPEVLLLTHVQNRGAAFGLFPTSTLPLALISLAVCVAIIAGRTWWIGRGRLMSVAIALEFGGAFGNLIDRVALGAVTDFVQFTPNLPWIGRWPAFNVADAALTTGALLLAMALTRSDRRAVALAAAEVEAQLPTGSAS